MRAYSIGAITLEHILLSKLSKLAHSGSGEGAKPRNPSLGLKSLPRLLTTVMS
jgi:hypothetical protein